MKELSNVQAENIYGHSKRLDWLISHLKKADRIVEFGCGTGYMITRPLSVLDYDVVGIDLDTESIEYGQSFFEGDTINANRLQCRDLQDLDFPPDVVIASEVLEHMTNNELRDVLQIIKTKLKSDGKLLVTVPNGYGWFELESFLWFKTGIGFILNRSRAARLISLFKKALFGKDIEGRHPSTLADSPHIQRFTHSSIQNLLANEGFVVKDIRGSVLLAGPFSDLFFTGVKPIMNINSKLGNLFPKLAAGFFCYCRLDEHSTLEE